MEEYALFYKAALQGKKKNPPFDPYFTSELTKVLEFK